MAFSVWSNSKAVLSIDEFIDYIEINIDVEDDSSVLSASNMLQGLANNKQLLIDVFNRDLLNYNTHVGSSYSQSSTILGAGMSKNFVVRANLWPPLSSGDIRTIENSLFSYELAHDHNFSFLTANYFGPGYETEIWENLDPYDTLRIGNSANLIFLERTKLEPTKVMYYRRKRDVHIQYPPEKFSVSLNLVVAKDQDFLDDQIEFDLKKKEVKSFPRGTLASKREFFMKAAGLIGDENTADILLSIANKHPCNRTRAAALTSASHILKL